MAAVGPPREQAVRGRGSLAVAAQGSMAFEMVVAV